MGLIKSIFLNEISLKDVASVGKERWRGIASPPCPITPDKATTGSQLTPHLPPGPTCWPPVICTSPWKSRYSKMEIKKYPQKHPVLAGARSPHAFYWFFAFQSCLKSPLQIKSLETHCCFPSHTQNPTPAKPHGQCRCLNLQKILLWFLWLKPSPRNCTSSWCCSAWSQPSGGYSWQGWIHRPLLSCLRMTLLFAGGYKNLETFLCLHEWKKIKSGISRAALRRRTWG